MGTSASFRDKFKKSDLAFTFRDLIILPGLSEIEPREVDIHSKVTRNIGVNVPFVSSPMDTVTESEMAISIARLGGVGILHRNCTVVEQVEMARRVKRAEALVIREVITVSPDQSIGQAVELMQDKNISGLPVVEGDRLVGILTGRDVRFADPKLKVRDLMTRKVTTANEGINIENAKEMMHEKRIEKLPIVDSKRRLKGLITIRDLLLRGRFPNAARDDNGQLLCGAAISPFDLDRAMKLDELVDILVVDVSHFHNSNVFAATKKLVSAVKSDVVVGNIGTFSAAEDAITKLGDRIAGFRVGIGSGSICTTMETTKAGAPTVYATAQVADAVRTYKADIPIIADGGIRGPGDVAIALILGASAVMIGNLFARTKEAPGTLMAIGGRYYKQYRGMGSASAMAKRLSDRYGSPAKGIAEGVEGWVPYKGELNVVVGELVSGLQASFGYAGARSISQLWERGKVAALTPSGVEEARPHDILLPTEVTERA